MQAQHLGDIVDAEIVGLVGPDAVLEAQDIAHFFDALVDFVAVWPSSATLAEASTSSTTTCRPEASCQLRATKSLVIVPGATHRFEEPGTSARSSTWRANGSSTSCPICPSFRSSRGASPIGGSAAPLPDRRSLILALPEALDSELDIVLVRKIGAPGHTGAVVEGREPQLALNDDAARMTGASPSYIEAEQARQIEEMERRRRAYRHGRPAISPADRTVIVVNDGIATGGTMNAVLHALERSGAAHIVLAVPMARPNTQAELALLADDTGCLATPEPFRPVGLHYPDFDQTRD